MNEKILFKVVCKENRKVDVVARADGLAIGFKVTESGALIVYLENKHGACWNIAAYAAGEWCYVERPEDHR